MSATVSAELGFGQGVAASGKVVVSKSIIVVMYTNYFVEKKKIGKKIGHRLPH